MGCDIHLAAELYYDGKWHNVLRPSPVPDWGTSMTREWYRDRNYDVFAALADVRNRIGVQPISDPRGLPADMDPISQRDYDMDPQSLAKNPYLNEGMVDGEHSASWLLLSEVLHWGGWIRPEDDREYHLLLLAGHAEFNPDLAASAEGFLESMRDLAAFARTEYGLAPDHVRIVFNFDS